MSKDLLKTATAKISSAAFNTIVFNNDNIEKSIRPELVSRIELHPTEVNGKIEDRTYYTLHNDAGDCVYVSEFLRINPEGEDKIETILPTPVIPDEIGKAPSYPTPPIPPSTIIPEPGKPDDNDNDDDNDDDEDITLPQQWPNNVIKPSDDEEEDETGPVWIPGGGGVVIDDDTDEPDDVFKPRVPKTNFDDYAQKLVDNAWFGYTPNIDFNGKTYNVTRFYEVTYSATSAKRAMKNTRNAYRNVGLTETRGMPKLVNAEEMFSGAAIHTFNASYPVVSNADKMFSGCLSLELVTFGGSSGASHLTSANDMFANCDMLRKASIGLTRRLSETSYIFYNCKSLKSVNISLTNLTSGIGIFYNCNSLTTLSAEAMNLKSLSIGDYMFYKCSSLKTYPNLYNTLSSARGMFSGCSSLPQFSNFNAIRNVTNGRQMFYGCSNITYADLNLPALVDGTQMFANCPITTISTTINLSSLQYGNGMLGAAKLDLTQASKVISALSKIGGMPPKNGDVNNGFHLGVLKDVPGENQELTWEKFLESWGYNHELGIIELDNGWQIVLNQNSL